jgi:diguanylate cyclase (GGDEF)-like protein
MLTRAEPTRTAGSASATVVITENPSSDGLPLSAGQVCQETHASARVIPTGGPLLTNGGARRNPRVPMVFGLALIVLVALGAVTLASITDLVSANASVTRSVEALERLQALKAAVRELEASELAILLTGRPQYRASYEAAQDDIVRLHGDLDRLLDSPPQRERLQQLAVLTSDVSAFFRNALAAGAAGGTVPPAAGWHSGLVSDPLIAAVTAIQQGERQVLREHRATSAARFSQAQSHVLVVSVLGFITILIAGLMVRRDVIERRNVTYRLERANATLAGAVAEAQQRREEITRLARLSHFLQGCRSSDEACDLIQMSASELFGAAGALYLVTGERLERAAAWDAGRELQQTFPREACWGMRQGAMHEGTPGSTAPGCVHLDGGQTATCVPLVADGGPFGLIVITPPGSADDRAAARSTVLAAAEQMAAGLANLRLRESLKIQSLQDPLTGLYNRRFLHDALSRECHDARRHADRPVALLLLDVDFFKRVNDTAGHAAGDVLLQALAELLGRTFRGSDIACRFGGEEFAMVLAETHLDVALRRAEALRLAIHGLHAHHGTAILEGLTVSIGVTAGSGEGLTPERLLREADTALYEAKARGRDCCVAYADGPGVRPLPFEAVPPMPLA